MKQYGTLVIELRKMGNKTETRKTICRVELSVSSVLRPKDETSPVRNSERKTRVRP